MSEKVYIIPPNRTRYLARSQRTTGNDVNGWPAQSDTADQLHAIQTAIDSLEKAGVSKDDVSLQGLRTHYDAVDPLFRQQQQEDPGRMGRQTSLL